MPDARTYIKVHDGIEDHPKIIALSDKAFRLLVTTWAWCSRHRTDGQVRADVWERRGTAKARAELVNAGLAEIAQDSTVHMHDYLEHQWSAEEITERMAAKQRAGRLGNHRRWHVRTGNRDPACEFCAESSPDGPRLQDRSHLRSPPDRTGRSQRDRKASLNTDTDIDNKGLTSRGDRYVSHRASERSTPRELAATAHSSAAHRLVEQYAASRARRPPARVLARLGPLVDELLAEHWPDALIAAALTAWGDKGLDPAALASVANEVANRAPHHGRPSTADQRVRDTQALKQLYADHPDHRQLTAREEEP